MPSASVGLRVGMRWWYGFIIMAWGLVATLTSHVKTARQLYAMRLLLGAFEAGATPCAWHILSSFYPYDKLTKPYASIIVCTNISSAISGPIAAALLSMHGVAGFAGWRWLFLLEGVPAMALGLVVWAVLPSDPLAAWWLPHNHREALHDAVHGGGEASDAARRRPSGRETWSMVVDAIRRPLLWVFIAVGLLWALAAFTLSQFLPLMISNMLSGTLLSSASATAGAKHHSVQAALLSTVPYFVAFVSTMLVAWHADRVGEKTAHVGVPYVIGAVVLCCFGPVASVSTRGGFAMLTLAMAFAFGGQSTMCARVAGLTPPAQAAITLSLFNAICASLGGFAGPVAVGAILSALKSFALAGVVLGLCMGVAGAIMLAVYALERRSTVRTGSNGGGRGSVDSTCAVVPGGKLDDSNGTNKVTIEEKA